MKIRDGRQGGLPGEIAAVRAGTDAAKDVSTPDISGGRGASEGGPRQLDRRNNNRSFDPCGAGHSRMVSRIRLSDFAVEFDSEVYPFACRRNLKFKITTRFVRTGSDKYLADVTVPKSECLLVENRSV